jgi:hypothetical protein
MDRGTPLADYAKTTSRNSPRNALARVLSAAIRARGVTAAAFTAVIGALQRHLILEVDFERTHSGVSRI